MITNKINTLIRKALAPTIETILNDERSRLNDIISTMEDTLDDVKSIRASDIADCISTYDIASDISLDSYEIARGIEIDAGDIEINTRDLADRIGKELSGYIDIDSSDIQIDYNSLSDSVGYAIQKNGRVDVLERKMDLILKHLGITPENA
jgi:hypothetical protein